MEIDQCSSRAPMHGDLHPGNVFVRGDKAYMSAQDYIQPTQPNTNGTQFIEDGVVDPILRVHEALQVKWICAGWQRFSNSHVECKFRKLAFGLQ